MIAVKIELWPFGQESRAREIGRMYIANDGTGGTDRGDYKVAVCRRGGSTEVPKEIYGPDPDIKVAKAMDPELAERIENAPSAMRAGEVKDYPRLAYNVWRLIARAILSAFPEETIATKKTVRPVIDTYVARGFELLAAPLRAALKNPEMVTAIPDDENGKALRAALEWLDAAGNE